MSKFTLYGDGINDDYLAIQELLDSGISEVYLPPPKKNYAISKTLKIHSGQTLRLGETTLIVLLPESSCLMLSNAEKDAHDISVIGGIWDYDNINQAPNPAKAEPDFWERTHADGNFDKEINYVNLGYMGCIMAFDHIERFSIHDLTLKNPVTFCLRMAHMKYFNVENIRFDQNLGNPTAENMDGVHIDGECHYGSIRNVQGTCYDDIVAINANDCYDGPVTNIEVDGVFGKDSLRGVRILSTGSLVNSISVSNVFGTFYQNCIGLTFFYPKLDRRGKMGNISISNVYGENAPRRPEYNKNGPYTMPFIWIEGHLDIESVTIDKIYRHEKLGDINTIGIWEGANVKNLSVSNVVFKNETGKPLSLIKNEGHIDRLYLYNLDSGKDCVLENKGTVNKIIEN